ncbi:MAG: hypothetical protein SAJ37_03695 [Oscillatoria sp. PMC 1068.18]|nr:hypothetical protein [Oscillatoria sp. PMC 1076.18]MEC4987831.1 hypothetical protein [Oscillatoria sp. PMC 1068.18]
MKTSCVFWLQWILANFGGFLLSLLLIEVGEKPDIGIVEALIGGTIVGLTQTLVLFRRIDRAWLWLFTSMIIWGLLETTQIGAVGWIVPRTLQIDLRLIYGAIHGAEVGICFGIAQWLILAKQISLSWLWILASIVSWAVGLSLGWAYGGVLRLATNLFLADVVGLGVAWAIAGGLTGFSLIWLLGKDTII